MSVIRLTSAQDSGSIVASLSHQMYGFQSEEKFLKGFQSDVTYVKLLAELELLKEVKSDDEDTGSVDELSIGSDNASLSSLTLCDGGFTSCLLCFLNKSNRTAISIVWVYKLFYKNCITNFCLATYLVK